MRRIPSTPVHPLLFNATENNTQNFRHEEGESTCRRGIKPKGKRFAEIEIGPLQHKRVGFESGSWSGLFLRIHRSASASICLIKS